MTVSGVHMSQSSHSTVEAFLNFFFYCETLIMNNFSDQFLFVNNVTEVIRNYNDTLFKCFVLYQVQLSPTEIIYPNGR